VVRIGSAAHFALHPRTGAEAPTRGTEALTVTVADALFVVSASGRATTLQTASLPGAVKRPVCVIEPQSAAHVTADTAVPVTVAFSWTDCRWPTAAVGGVTSITTEDAATDDVATGAPLHAATPTATSTASTLRVRATVIRGHLSWFNRG
jgi:hypothetical protein